MLTLFWQKKVLFVLLVLLVKVPLITHANKQGPPPYLSTCVITQSALHNPEMVKRHIYLGKDGSKWPFPCCNICHKYLSQMPHTFSHTMCDTNFNRQWSRAFHSLKNLLLPCKLLIAFFNLIIIHHGNRYSHQDQLLKTQVLITKLCVQSWDKNMKLKR